MAAGDGGPRKGEGHWPKAEPGRSWHLCFT